MKTGVKAMLILFLAFATGMNLSAQDKAPHGNLAVYPDRIQRYGHGFSDPHDFTPGEYAYIAKNYSIFTVEKRHAWADYGPKPNTEAATIGTAKKLKEINPDIKVLMYWNIVLNWNFYESQTEFNEHPEWRYRDWEFEHVNIDPIPTYDLNNPEVQEWWINAIADPVLRGDLDGVFLDAAPKVPMEHYASLFKMIDTLRARIGEDKIVIYNGFRVDSTVLQGGQDFIDHTSGVYIEFFLARPNDTKEEAALLFDNLIEAQKKGKMIVPCGKPGSVLPGTRQEPIFFNIASFLLFYGPDSYYLFNSGYSKTRGMLKDYPEYELSPGRPLGSAVRKGWVYTRDFERMTVTVDLEKKEAKIEAHEYTPLKQIEANWESMAEHYEAPQWFSDGKIGIWSHWGPGSVEDRPEGLSARERIDLWKAEKWDPDALVKFFKENGACFIMPVGSHHGNFDRYESFHPWNSVEMGPKRDILGDWKAAAEKHGLKFGVSSHLYWSPALPEKTPGPQI